MFIMLTRGFFRHSEPEGSGQPILVRLTDIERIDERPSEKWLGETERRHVGSAVYLLSLRDSSNSPRYTGDGYGYYHVRESVAEISASISAAMPAFRAIHDHGVLGAVRVGGIVNHASTGSVEHLHSVRDALPAPDPQTAMQ